MTDSFRTKYKVVPEVRYNENACPTLSPLLATSPLRKWGRKGPLVGGKGPARSNDIHLSRWRPPWIVQLSPSSPFSFSLSFSFILFTSWTINSLLRTAPDATPFYAWLEVELRIIAGIFGDVFALSTCV